MLAGVGLDELGLDGVAAFLQVGDAGPQAEASEELQRVDGSDTVSLQHVGEYSLGLGTGMCLIGIVVIFAHSVLCYYVVLKGCGGVVLKKTNLCLYTHEMNTRP